MVDRSFAVRLAAETAAYEQAMGRAADATRKVGQEGEKSGSLIGRAMSSGVQTLSRVTAAGAAGAAILGTAIMKTGASYNTLEQQARAAMSTVLGSADAAEQMMTTLGEFTATSPFPRQVFIEATQQLLAFDMQAQDVIPTLSAVQDAVAAAGGSSQQITEVVNVLAQVQSTGKITAETLNQLGYRGINAAKLIGAEFNMTAAEVRDSISNGTMDAYEALDALRVQMSATYGGAAENVKQTWIGATDRIRAAFRDISSLLMEPLISKGGGGTALDWANALADGMRAAERQVGPLTEALTGRLGGSLDSITDRLASIAPAIDDFDLSRITDDLDELVQYAPLVGAVGTALVVMGTNSIPVLSSLGLAGINPVVAGLSALVALHPGLRGVLGDFLSDLSPLVPILGETAAGLLDAGTAIIDALLPGLSAVLDAISPAAIALGSTLGGSAVLAAQALVPVAEALSAVLEVVGMIPGPVSTAVLAFAAFRGLNISGLVTPLRGVTEQIALQQTLARNAGIQVGTFGAAMGAASVQAQRLGGALKTAFLSNPIGIALAGLTTVYGAFAASNRDAKARVDALTDSLDEQTGAITDNTIAVAAQQLNDDGWLRRYEAWGGAVNDLTAAYAGQPDAMDRVRTHLGQLNQEQIAAGQFNEQHGTEAMRLLGVLEGQAPVMAAAADETRLLADAQREVGDAATPLPLVFAGLMESMHGFAVEQGAVNDGMATNIAYVEEALEAYYEWLEATRESSAGFVDMSGAMKASQDATRAWAEETAAATEDAEDSWEDYYDGTTVSLQKVRDELLKQIEAQTNWERNIQSLVGRVPDAYVQMLLDMGVESAPLVQALADDHSGLTEEIGKTWEEAGQLTPQRFAEQLALQQTVVGIAARKLGDGAALEISQAIASGEMSVAEAVAEYDLRAEVEVMAETSPFAGAVLDEIHRTETAEIVATVLADVSNAEYEALAWEARTAALVPVPQVNAVATLATRVADTWFRETDALEPTPDINADPRKGDNERRAFIERVRTANPIMAMFLDASEARREMSAFFAAYQGTRIGVNIGFGNADGGFHDRGTRYADGGIDAAGRHVPRVSQMGGPQFGKRFITWGEDVTNWEAYISGKPGMEARNRLILQEAARRMGMTVLDALDVPRVNFADGGMYGVMDLRMTEQSRFADALEGLQRDWMGSQGGGVNHGGAYGWHPTGIPWQALWMAVKALAPESILTSAYRPGAITASGVPSLHGQGRAIDVVSGNMAATFMKILAAFGGIASQLFYTPMGNLQVGYRDAIIARTHWDHIHLGVEDGGLVEAMSKRPKVADTGVLNLDPGWNPPTYNGLSRTETLVDVEKLYGAAAHRWASPGWAGQAAPAADFSALGAAADKILAAAASIPDRIEVPVRVDSREIAHAGRRGEASIGAPGKWSGAPRLGRDL